MKKKDRLIKIEGENRITFNGVVETVARLLCEEDKETVTESVDALQIFRCYIPKAHLTKL